MSLAEKRKFAVSETDSNMNRCIKNLHLNAEDEEKLYAAIYRHIDAVRKDVYADGVHDTMEFLNNAAPQLKKMAEEFAD